MAEMKSPKTRQYEVDGMTVEIPLFYDERVKRYLEDYPDFKDNPIYTPKGHPLVLCIEDACEFAEAIEPPRLIDCSDCKYFRRAAEKTLFGVCDNKKRQCKDLINPQKEAE